MYFWWMCLCSTRAGHVYTADIVEHMSDTRSAVSFFIYFSFIFVGHDITPTSLLRASLRGPRVWHCARMALT